MILETAISLVGGFADGFSLYDRVSTLLRGHKNKSLLEQMNCHLERISDNILLAEGFRGVTDTTKTEQSQLHDPREIRQLLEPLQKVSNEEIISSALINTPDKMTSAMNGNPWEVLINITPAAYAAQPNDSTMVPVMFEHGGVRYIGWQKKGTLPILFDCEMHDLPEIAGNGAQQPPIITPRPPRVIQPRPQQSQVAHPIEEKSQINVVENRLKEDPLAVFLELGCSVENRLLKSGTVFRDTPFAPEMVVIPPGSFIMGSPDGEGRGNENPQHEVTISQPFAMGRYAVRFEEWDAFVTDTGGGYKPDDEGWGRGRRPVINVSWDDAKIYIKWLSEKTGKTYALPTEAQWEYACRAGTTTVYSFGDSISKAQANFGMNIRKTTEVGKYPTNQFGLYDMHGNVSEWCHDLYGYYGIGSQIDPQGPNESSYRVNRGGSYRLMYEGYLCSAARNDDTPERRSLDLGFRLLRQVS